MSLFSNIYNTVAKFFRQQEDLEEASKSVATNRLKLVLMQDRTNLTPRILEQMRSELIDLLSRYVELDKELLDLNFEQEGDQVALMLSIPVIRAKDEDEIDAAIKAHNDSLKAMIKEDTDSEDTNDVSLESDEIVSENTEQSDIEEKSNIDTIAEDETEETHKAEEIAKELQTKTSVIKKKKVSTPEDISNNPFKPDNVEVQDSIETPTEG